MCRFCGTDVDTNALPSNVRLSCILPVPWILGQTFQVRGCLLCQEVAAHPFNRENSTFYPHSMATISHMIPRAVSVLGSHQSAIVDQTPRFNNSEFIDNSSQSFLNSVITMDPSIKWDLLNTLPQWPQWIEEDAVEMLFNRTAMDVPILKRTSARLQNRCE